MHPLVRLAIQAVEHFIETGKPLPCPNLLPDDLKQNAGAFVTIKIKTRFAVESVP
jgi:AMMECR1 domain-containing protein